MSNSKEQLFSDEYFKRFLGSTEFDSFEDRWYKWENYVKQNPPKKEERDYIGVRFKHPINGIMTLKSDSRSHSRFRYHCNESGSYYTQEYIDERFADGTWIEVKEENPIKQVTVNTDFEEFVYNNPDALEDVEQPPLVHSELPEKEIHEILYLKNKVDELERRLSYVELRGFATPQMI